MALIENEGAAPDGVGSTYDVECDDDNCGVWRRVSMRTELASGPTFLPDDDWKATKDGRTYCPEHAPERV